MMHIARNLRRPVLLITSLLVAGDFLAVVARSPALPPAAGHNGLAQHGHGIEELSSGSGRHNEQGREGGNGAGTRLVKVDLAVMSRCPDARLCEAVMDDVFAQPGVREKVDVKLRYIAEPDLDNPYGGKCKHGDVECRGNLHQLCVQHLLPNKPRSSHPPSPHRHDPQRPFPSRLPSSSFGLDPIELTSLPPVWSFVQASNYDYARIGDDAYAEECAKAVGIDWVGSGVEGCVNGSTSASARVDEYGVEKGLSLGARLAYESAKGLKKIEVGKSCTILIEDEVRCIHDGEWYACDDGHERGDFVRSIEEAYHRLNKGQ